MGFPPHEDERRSWSEEQEGPGKARLDGVVSTKKPYLTEAKKTRGGDSLKGRGRNHVQKKLAELGDNRVTWMGVFLL